MMMAATLAVVTARPSPAEVTASSAAATTEAARAVPAPSRLSIGVNDLGGQLRLHVTPAWAVEARGVFGSASSNEGSIHSMVLGLRGYRFFSEHRRCKLYLGLEGDYAKTSIRTVNLADNSTPGGGIPGEPGFGNTSGYAVGGFAGLEFHVARRIAIDLDMGPYLIGLKEQATGTSASNWDFVVNTALNFYLF
jgi:hypothetical protein